MAIKIISGVLFPHKNERALGSAKISLEKAALLPSSDARWDEVTVIGSGAFVGRPATQVSLRHIITGDTGERASFNLNDDLIIEKGVATGVSVSWNCTPRTDGDEDNAEVLEISVLIIGETK